MSSATYEQTNTARDELFESLGQVDSDVIAHVINPAFMGGPRWPALRQAFSIIRTNDSIMVASNGLSDPFDDVEEPNNGYRVEIIAETKEKLTGGIAGSWLFKLVYALSQQAAHSGQMADFIEGHGVITMELFAQDCGLEEFQNAHGMVGVMIGVEHPELPKKIQFPAEHVFLAAVQILTPDELAYVVEKRAEGRNHLHGLMRSSGLYHFISPGRASLLKNDSVPAKKAWWNYFGKG
ncbi:suppressor of fused domain protein [Xanthomonas campestris]|uniref:suppressor of fused domain protein n=1 Tax=Xanthomonas campestris TaxID=339 RepID=UPI0021695A9F|nr:suppressor of fused domain protein [Xanthomonas campestris]MCS3848500.1 hypothetical protein [Xanthomonas campestris]MCW2038273.1 hypothetical protein [Xanthomonas campestris]